MVHFVQKKETKLIGGVLSTLLWCPARHSWILLSSKQNLYQVDVEAGAVHELLHGCTKVVLTKSHVFAFTAN